MIKLVSKELSDSYKLFKPKSELYKKATRLGNSITRLGFIFFLMSLIIPITMNIFFFEYANSYQGTHDIGQAFIGSFFFGFLLVIIGSRINSRKPLPSKLSIEKEEFIKVYESLEDIETYKEDKSDDFLRTKIEKNLSKVERKIEEPSWNYDTLWETITKDIYEDIRLLKKNIKERLLPNIFHDKEDDAKRAYLTLEKFAQYLLSPTISGLKELNKSMEELTQHPQKETRIISQLIPILGRPYVRHSYILTIFGFFSFLVFRLGIGVLNVSIDNAYLAGTGLFGALTAGYMAFMIRKS